MVILTRLEGLTRGKEIRVNFALIFLLPSKSLQENTPRSQEVGVELWRGYVLGVSLECRTQGPGPDLAALIKLTLGTRLGANLNSELADLHDPL